MSLRILFIFVVSFGLMACGEESRVAPTSTETVQSETISDKTVNPVQAVKGATELATNCGALNRPNIDCACVSRRLGRISDVLDDEEVTKTLLTQYDFHLGLGLDEADFMTEDQLKMALAEQKLVEIGGWPDDIAEFEEGCVIEDAPSLPVAQPSSVAALEAIGNCVFSSGTERFCQCDTDKVMQRLTEEQFISYTRGESEFLGRPTSLAQLPNSKELTGEAALILESAQTDDDIMYCTAVTYADEMVGQTASERTQLPALSDRPTDLPTTAEELIAQNCAAGGNSAAYCQCYSAAFRREIADNTSAENAMAVALLTSSENIDDAWVTEQMMTMDSSVQQAVMPFMISATMLGDNCQ